MAFFKKIKKKINGKWYPKSITVGKPVTTDEVAKRLATQSTVSLVDTFAVLKSMANHQRTCTFHPRDLPKQ